VAGQEGSESGIDGERGIEKGRKAWGREDKKTVRRGQKEGQYRGRRM